MLIPPMVWHGHILELTNSNFHTMIALTNKLSRCLMWFTWTSSQIRLTVTDSKRYQMVNLRLAEM